jgi:predicted nucleic acid-binding protein
VIEFRCLLARRRRSGEIGQRIENQVFAAFQRDVREGLLAVHPLSDAHASAALDILTRLKTHPLRSLDALHLAIVQDLGASTIATADPVMARAAAALGAQTVRFD